MQRAPQRTGNQYWQPRLSSSSFLHKSRKGRVPSLIDSKLSRENDIIGANAKIHVQGTPNPCFDILFPTSPQLSHSFAPPGCSLNRHCSQCFLHIPLLTYTIPPIPRRRDL